MRLRFASILVVIASANAARADLTPPSLDGVRVDRSAARLVADRGALTPEAAAGFDTSMPGDLPVLVSPLTSSDPTPIQDNVRQLPALQGSAQLCMLALGSLGLWHLGRNTSRFAGALPDWYHEAAPQVGHSTPYEFRLDLQPAAFFAQPRIFVPHRSFRFIEQPVPSEFGHWYRDPHTPRAPPVHHTRIHSALV